MKKLITFLLAILIAQTVFALGNRDNTPDYISGFSWTEISQTEADAIWETYDLTKKIAEYATVYSSDAQKTRVFKKCPVYYEANGYYLYYAPMKNMTLGLNDKPEDCQVFRAKEDSSVLRFVYRYVFEDGTVSVKENVFQGGWLIQLKIDVYNSHMMNDVVVYQK